LCGKHGSHLLPRDDAGENARRIEYAYDANPTFMMPAALCATNLCLSGSCFTGKERDAESGNDYFGARYYNSAMGRFMSPDWCVIPWAVPYADLTNPQSLSLYVYGANNPLRFKDLDGHMHQECQHNSTSSLDANGTIHLTVNEHCDNVADFWDYQWWGNHAVKAVKNSVKFALSPRGRTLGKGIQHIGLGYIKARNAALLFALAVPTDGTTAYLGGYLALGSVGEFSGGTADIIGAFASSDNEQASLRDAGDKAADITTISGLTALAVTDGNVDTANKAVAVEDLFTTGGQSLLTGEPLTLLDWASQANDLYELSKP
jgi:RHS repeat-associated protein